jgi:predicted ATPase/signal transduction histidine kinase/tRNA A-37 threonylcarbamoyl transferase component Bud32
MPDHARYSVAEVVAFGRGTLLYRAIREPDHRRVLLKVVDPEQHDPHVVERLHRELEIGRALDVAGVVRPVGMDVYQGEPALVLEDFSGPTLEQLIGPPMEVGRFLELAIGVARAVADVHGREVLLKDLKPDHLVVDPSTHEVKLVELGLASRLPREVRTARPARLIEGSLPYLSPEQTGRTNRAVDSRADLYALGVICFQMLTGRLPFHAHDALEWIYCHVARTPPSPAEIIPGLPEMISRIVLKLLAKMPGDRYQTAHGLTYDLERAADSWRREAAIAPFPLGERDLSDRLRLPQRLYGRERELARLVGALDRVAATGRSELVLISGYSGVGKSSLVHELSRWIVRVRGLFVSGKFDQYARNIPYSIFVQAFTQLALDALAEDDEGQRRWREALGNALGSHARLIVDMIPPFRLLLGEQPPAPELPPAEQEQRWRRVFLSLVGVFARREHPLVLFLDDLQWADAGSLRLFEELAADTDNHHLLTVGAYRDTETLESHPLRAVIERIHATPAVIGEIALGPLDASAIQTLVAEAVHAGGEEVRPLAELVHRKTGGNPFFALRFLAELHEERILRLDEATSKWTWDLARIEERGYTDNVVDFMVRRLARLRSGAQEVLKIAACVGNRSPAWVLAKARETSEEKIAHDLWEPIAEGLFARAGSDYLFAHDRVQQAAYSLIPERHHPEMHLQIGRLLLADTPAERLDDQIFDVVTQLDLGTSLITDEQERLRVAELNLIASRRAKAATAFGSAAQFASAGLALLPPSCWETNYELTYDLSIARAESEWLSNRHDVATELIDRLLAHARGRAHLAAIYRLRIDLEVSRGDSRRATQTALAAFSSLLGIEFQLHPTQASLEARLEKTWRELGDRPIEELARLPAMTDPVMRAIMAVFSSALPAAYFLDWRLHDEICCQIVHLSLLHGNDEYSPHGYVTFGAALGRIFGRWDQAYRFGRVAEQLVEEAGGLKRGRGVAHWTIATFIDFWVRPVREVIPLFERSFETSSAVGNLTLAGFGAARIVVCRLIAGDPLAEVAAEAEHHLEFARRTHARSSYSVVDIYRYVQRLRGVSSAPGDEVWELREQCDPAARFPSWRFIQLTFQAWSALLFGDDETAAAAVIAAREDLPLYVGQIPLADYTHVAALALARRHPHVPPDEQRDIIDALTGFEEQHRVWQTHCPTTFSHWHALISAELARLRGQDLEAMRLYDRAIDGARRNGFVQDEAIASETAAHFHLDRGFATIATAYLQQARAAYARWGAEAKVAHLDELHPSVRLPGVAAPTATVALRPEQLDLLSVVKASQTISSEILLDQLLHTLLEVVLVQSGAQRGVLLLTREGQLSIEAEAAVEDDRVVTKTLQSVPASATAQLPMILLRYVELTKQRVILDGAEVEAGPFAGDRYFIEAKPRSVLCLPILTQARVVGLLYLENRAISGAFTPDRLLALELLATQSAISVENALSLSRERAARAAAVAAERRVALLGEVAARLAESLDYEELLTGLCQLCVRSLAEWCVLDVVENGVIRRAAGAHSDPQKRPLVDELLRRYPPRWTSPHPGVGVLHTGQPLLNADLTDENLALMVEDEAHARLIRGLGTRSSMILPLIARGQMLAVLSLGSSQPGHYGPADLDLARAVAGRAAVALDNARLYRASREAVQVRDEFLSVASHELNTPMTSLMLSLQALKDAPASSLSEPKIERMVGLAARQGERMAKLIGDLLDATRIEQGNLPLHLETLDLGDLVTDVLARLRPALARAQCEVSLRRDGPTVGDWDASRLDQVITNLVANAAKFGAHRPIEISVAGSERAVHLAVTDHGIGFDPAQTRVFERFARGVSVEHYGGLGLGLYISRRIVEAHGGSIGVESQAGAGATFTVELPRFPSGRPRVGRR